MAMSALACTRPSAAVCGAGTEIQGNECVAAKGPDAAPSSGNMTYQILSSKDLDADGHTKHVVLVVGANPDGTAVHGDVVLTTSRPGAGDFVPAAVTLGDLGGSSSFVPCNALTPGCLGPLTLSVALASNPTTPVAHVDVQLVAPPGVGSPTHCLTGGNVLYLEGNDYIYTGTLTVTAAGWDGTGAPDRVRVTATPTDPQQGSSWELRFETKQLGIAMTPSVYEDVQNTPYAQPGHPGMSVFGAGHACNTVTGSFQVHDYTYAPATNAVQSVTVSFEQHCEGSTTTMLVGCVHFAR
jgi:hypothetical protein